MQNGDLLVLLGKFDFYLASERRLSHVSKKRDFNIVKRLLRQDKLQSRDQFLQHCLERLNHGISAATINKDIAAVYKFLDFMDTKWERIKCFKVEKKNIPAPSMEETANFRSIHTTDAMDLFWDLHITCGTRPSEILNLRPKNIDIKNSCLYPGHTKTNDGLPIVILPDVKRKLEAYMKQTDSPDDYLFASSIRANRPLSIAAIEKDCRKRLKIMRCSKNYTPYSFRHAYITVGLAHGVPVQYIQRTARHTNISTTMAYLDRSVDYAKQAAYSHPYYKQLLSTQQIVADCVQYIQKMTDDRFDEHKLNKVYIMLYDCLVS